MNRILFLLSSLCCLMLFSCVEECLVESSEVKTEQQMKSNVKSKAAARTYESMPNPYALDVMQSVYDSYNVDKTLNPTDLYVRFMPRDSSQLQSLLYDYNLELFDYPLDIDLEEGEVYVDPSVQEGDFTWLYTTVKPDFVFPEGLQYEIIEECYLPEDGETVIETKGGAVILEDEAFKSLGYEPEVLTKGSSDSPSGNIQVYDDSLGVNVPVKGVKIRCRVFVKCASAYTDENGDYAIEEEFWLKPHYSIVFDNIKDFTVWGNVGPLAPANYNLGKHSKSGWSADIVKNCSAWYWCAINNAAYDYYEYCEDSGIHKPPYRLKILTFANVRSGSAPMLRRINTPIICLSDNLLWTYYANVGLVMGNFLLQMVRVILPDITIGLLDKDYEDIYEVVNHELSHASHFAIAHSPFWAEYISYIISSGAYGEATDFNAQLCAIGEMWGFTMGNIRMYDHYGKTKEGMPEGSYGWIRPHVFWDLIVKSVLTPKEIFNCLGPDVKTYDELYSELCYRYSDKRTEISEVFQDYMISHSVVETDFLFNREISQSMSLSNKRIEVEGYVNVIDGATLTLCGTEYVLIDGPFSVASDSQLLITN